MAHFLIINTGGTIGMEVGQHGLLPSPTLLADAFSSLPTLAPWRDHDLSWTHWSPLRDSAELTVSDWFRLRADINRYPEVDGVLVIHGTDTLAYSAAALSFLLGQLTKAVVVTGSMLPINADFSDAPANLNLALDCLLAARAEVQVAIDGKVFPGSRVSKVSTATRDCFKAPNWQQSDWLQPSAHAAVTIDESRSDAFIDLITLFPGCQPQADHYRGKQPAAVLLQAYGDGNIAATAPIQRFLRTLNDLQIPLFVRSQCFAGKVCLGHYQASKLLLDHGAVGCGDMTLEAAITKLTLLAGTHSDPEKLIAGFLTPMAREWQQR